MPVERRSLRSNSKSDTSSSTNGEKARSNSQSSTSNKDKAAPTTRSAANKAKSAPAKKGAAGKGASNSNPMGGDQPHANGSEPVENGVNGVEDVEMEEDTAGGPTSSIQTNKDRDGDEMTVVVPPSKGSRLSGQPGQDTKKDQEGDVSMEGTEEKEAKETEPEIDPRAKAVQGELGAACLLGGAWTLTVKNIRYQEQLQSPRARGDPIRPQIYPPRLAVDILDAETYYPGRPGGGHCRHISQLAPDGFLFVGGDR